MNLKNVMARYSSLKKYFNDISQSKRGHRWEIRHGLSLDLTSVLKQYSSPSLARCKTQVRSPEGGQPLSELSM